MPTVPLPSGLQLGLGASGDRCRVIIASRATSFEQPLGLIQRVHRGTICCPCHPDLPLHPLSFCTRAENKHGFQSLAPNRPPAERRGAVLQGAIPVRSDRLCSCKGRLGKPHGNLQDLSPRVQVRGAAPGPGSCWTRSAEWTSQGQEKTRDQVWPCLRAILELPLWGC